MAHSRNRSVDILGLALLAIAFFLLLSVASYDPADGIVAPMFPLNRIYQPDPLTLPQHPTITNWCGTSGAITADIAYRLAGWGAIYAVLSLFACALVVLSQRPLVGPFIRLFGWMLTTVGLCTLCTTLFHTTWNGPMIGPGGIWGAIGHAALIHLGTAGTVLTSVCLMAVGVLLCTDYVLLHVAALTATKACEKTRNLRRRRAATVTEELAEDEMQVRIRGKHQRGSAATEWEIEDDEDEELDEYDDTDEDEEDEEEEADDEADEEEDEEEESLVETAQSTAQSGAVVAAAASSSKGLRGLIERASPGLRIRKGTDRKPEKPDERLEVIEQLNEASRQEETREYDLPSIELLAPAEDFSYDQQEKEVRRKARILEKTFQNFGFNVKVVEIETGPVIAQYEIELEAGLRLSKITGLADDLAIALRVPSVRIVAPIPGKNTVGIEVPNERRQVVRLREVMEESDGRIKKMGIPLFLGKDVSGNPLTADLSTLPHLLIAGRTGTGKSVCLNAIISSILMTRRPDEVRMLMIDPKMVELSGYKTLPHLMHPVVTDMRKAEAILAWAVDKMEERYALLASAGVRHISGYNQLGEEELIDRLQPETDDDRKAIPLHLPYIVIVADEMADLMMTSGKEVEQHIIRLAQKSRAVGIHLILATQKPTVDVITGLIKSNLPARIAFQVASRTDSRVVLDEMGADKLLGNGDMLFLWPGTSTLLRGQGTYLSDEEINAIVECVSTGEQDFIRELVQLKVEDSGDSNAPGQLKNRDELYEGAVDIVVREGRGSVSLLQRCLGIGYGRAARLIDFMAEDGIVGPYNGSQAREVVISQADWDAMQAGATAEPVNPGLPEPPPEPVRRSNKIVTRDTPPKEKKTHQDEEQDEYEGEEYEVEEYEYDEDASDEAEDDTDEEEGEEYEYEDEDYDGEEYEIEDEAEEEEEADEEAEDEEEDEYETKRT
jgi:S-DNA-T family DNA segregation ATPase FtsK/SpoIIIE